MQGLSRNAISRISQFLILLFSIGFLHAQTPNNWTLHSEKNGVKLYSSTAMCGDKNLLIFKFENTNPIARRVNYNVIVMSEGRNMPLLPQSLELGASETKTGNCDADKELIADLRGITSYDLKVILVVN